MRIRGAPAIGITAAYGMALAARAGEDREAARTLLASTRPTAVNLFWALERMKAAGDTLEEAHAIAAEDERMCQQIGDHGAELFGAGSRVLTHCNAGALATGDYGTALGVIRSAHKQGKVNHVWVDETRPFLQGARLTAWELMADGIPCKLICDNMAGHFMQRGEVDAVVVGADRVTANGDVANKIGTYTLAVLCKEHGIPFFVAAPSSTVDMKLSSGKDIPIEERDGREVREVFGVNVAPQGVEVRNPAFDVTPNHLITALITERGVLRPPYTDALKDY
jgi:methylthioribose-1-phosphate isomerase